MRYGITPPIWWPFRWWPASSGFNPGIGVWKMKVVSKYPIMEGTTFGASMDSATISIGGMTGDTKMATMDGVCKMATMIAA